jgi:8-oxo-dGTP pyrophosphatase MutT (NUDIX family)
MALQERSAGVIVFRNPFGQSGTEEFLLLDYGRYWDYAKGHVELGESDEAAARRELAEETGIRRIELVAGFKKEIVYFFKSKLGLVRKSVLFFLGQVESDQVTISHEHVGYEWLPYEAAMQRLEFGSAREVLHAAYEHLQSHKT